MISVLFSFPVGKPLVPCGVCIRNLALPSYSSSSISFGRIRYSITCVRVIEKSAKLVKQLLIFFYMNSISHPIVKVFLFHKYIEIVNFAHESLVKMCRAQLHNSLDEYNKE